MNLSFYTAATGARAHQTRMDIIGNNIANINTEGFKSKNAGFVDLLYERYFAAATEDPETGVGVRVETTNTLFTQGGVIPTGGAHDFAIMGDGFFSVFDNATGEIYYTRNGNFVLSNFSNDTNMFYLVNQMGHIVLDREFGLISVDTSDENQEIMPGVFDFNIQDGLVRSGNNLFQTTPKNGEPFLNDESRVVRGYIEMSNVDLAQEMSRVIEAQRAFQLSIRMVQTSDEVENTIINLR